MFELASPFVEPIKTRTPAPDPEITACIFKNAAKITAFAEVVPVFRAGNIMSDFPRLSIQSIQGAREQPYPQNAIGLLVNRGGLAGGESLRVCGAMRIMAELFLLEIENIKSTILSAHPKQAGPITVYWNNAIIAEAIRVRVIVLEESREMLRAPVKVIQAQVRWHPESILPIIEKCAAFQSGSTRAQTGIR